MDEELDEQAIMDALHERIELNLSLDPQQTTAAQDAALGALAQGYALFLTAGYRASQISGTGPYNAMPEPEVEAAAPDPQPVKLTKVSSEQRSRPQGKTRPIGHVAAAASAPVAVQKGKTRRLAPKV